MKSNASTDDRGYLEISRLLVNRIANESEGVATDFDLLGRLRKSDQRHQLPTQSRALCLSCQRVVDFLLLTVLRHTSWRLYQSSICTRARHTDIQRELQTINRHSTNSTLFCSTFETRNSLDWFGPDPARTHQYIDSG